MAFMRGDTDMSEGEGVLQATRGRATRDPECVRAVGIRHGVGGAFGALVMATLDLDSAGQEVACEIKCLRVATTERRQGLGKLLMAMLDKMVTDDQALYFYCMLEL